MTTPKTAEELGQLANDVIQNKVFMTNSEEGVKNSFGMVLALMDDPGRDALTTSNPACFYANFSEAAPMAINGYPQFFSLSWLSQKEWAVFYPILQEKQNLLGISR